MSDLFDDKNIPPMLLYETKPFDDENYIYELKLDGIRCLAVTPALKSYGVAGRARLFEVIQKVKEINRGRRRNAKDRKFTGKSYLDSELKADPSLELDYIVAPPRMAHYIDYSTKIYQIYLQYAAPDDIHVYSIDEVFIDVTSYLNTAKCTAREYAMRMIKHVLKETGITATAGIGTNMYLCKVAMLLSPNMYLLIKMGCV